MLKSKLKNLLQNAIIFIFAFYSVNIFFPLLKLPYSNPENIIGPLANLAFNPANNSLRFAMIVVFVPLIFLYFQKLKQNNKTKLLRQIFSFLFVLRFFFNETTLYLSRYSNIDMFHSGERLGVGSALHFFGKKLFTETFFIHGAFADPLLAVGSFKLFGPSIGSYYLLDSLLKVFTYLVFVLMLKKIIKNNFLFFAANIFFYSFFLSFPPSQTLARDITVFIFIIIAYLTFKKRVPEKLGFLITSFLSFSTLYYSVDRGIYLLLVNFVFLAAYIAYRKKLRFYALKLCPYCLIGTALSVFTGLAMFGGSGFLEFFKTTFVIIPKITPLLSEYKYPQFSLDGLRQHWWPIVLILINTTFLVNYLRKGIKRNGRQYFFIMVINALSIVFYKSALGRSDVEHIWYVSYYVVLVSFLILDYLAKTEKKWAKISLTASLLFFILPGFSYQRVFDIANYDYNTVKIYFALPKINDNYWLTNEQEMVRDYVVSKTDENDYVFVFTNESAYYYLFKRKNPTRFYTVWFASPNFYEQEVLSDIKRKPPKLVVYKSRYWSNNIDGISSAERLKTVAEWIENNYPQKKQIGNTEIRLRK